MLTLEQVRYRYPGASHDALHGVTLEVPDGRITGLVGPSESGKSTLCLVAGGLAPRSLGGQLTGRLLIDGTDMGGRPLHELVGPVVTGLQDPAGQLSLVADTVFEEVAFGPLNLGLPRGDVVDRANEALELVGVGDLAGRDPRRLSGGQQQLVVIAGLLAMRPRHLVLDEPIAHLDGHGSRRVLDAISTAADLGTAVLVAEKRTAELSTVATSMAVVSGGDIVSAGRTADVLADPAVLALGVDEPSKARIRRLAREAGLDPRTIGEAP